MWNKCLLILFIIGLLFIGTITGSILSYYKLQPSKLVSESIQWAETWHGIYKSNAATERKRRKNKSKRKNKTLPPETYWNKSKAYNGYTLISKRLSPKVQLIDMQGNVVHRWNVPLYKAWPEPKQIPNTLNLKYFIYKAHVFPNGDLLTQYSAVKNTPYGVGIAKYDKYSNLIWQYNKNAHHDFYIDKEDGDIYALTHEMLLNAPKGTEQLEFPMLVDYIVRLNSEGEELQRVSPLEAFKNSPYYPMLFYKYTFLKGNSWDKFHTNSIMKLEANVAQHLPIFNEGQVLISIRNPSMLAMVDMDKNSVIWVSTGRWKMQHEVKFTPEGSIALFDNQGAGGKRSRVLLIDPKTQKTIKEYAKKAGKKFYSVVMGKTQILGNGNILVTSSLQRNAFELTPTGESVWNYQYKKDQGGWLATAHRYSREELPFLFEKP